MHAEREANISCEEEVTPKKIPATTQLHRIHWCKTMEHANGKDKERTEPDEEEEEVEPYIPTEGAEAEEEKEELIYDKEHRHFYVAATDWNSYRHQSHVVVMNSK